MHNNLTDSRPTVIDQRGRTVILPERVSRILTLQPILTQLVWRLAPHKLLNVDRLFKARLSSFPCPKEDLNLLSSLPVVGVYFDPPDQEQVIALKPDLVATMAGDPNLEAYPEICNCPAIAANKTNLSDCAVTIRMLGQVV